MIKMKYSIKYSIKMIDKIDNSNINIYSITILYKNLICYKNVFSKLFLARKNTIFKYGLK